MKNDKATTQARRDRAKAEADDMQVYIDSDEYKALDELDQNYLGNNMACLFNLIDCLDIRLSRFEIAESVEAA